MNDDSPRFKIMNFLLDEKDSFTLTELSKELGFDKELVAYHLKILKENFLVAEVDKRYTLQGFFYDENVMEILNSAMKSIILTILRELKDMEYTEEQLQDAVKNNLQLFIENFAMEIGES